MMKKFTAIVFIFICFGVIGQQIPQYTQYIFNYFSVNPAVAGSKECMDVKLGYRSQWVGFPGAPKTTFASVHTRLQFKKKRTIRANHGVGIYVDSDVTGYLSRTTLNFAYAYHFPVGREITASVGVFAGLNQLRIDATQIIIGNTNDPAIGGSGSAFIFPNVSPGILLNHKNWFAGLSIREVVPRKWKIIGTNQTKNTYHYALTAGKRLLVNDYISFIPSAHLKFAPNSAPALDINGLWGITKNIEVGASWRNVDALAGIVKINFLKYFSLGYSFDFTTSKIRHGSSNTHEIVISIYGCPQEDDYSCPAFN